MDLANLTAESFAPYVGETFAIGSDLELTLDAADALGGRPGSRQPFELILAGPPEPLLPQAIYPLTHPVLGTLEIFIVPIGRDDASTTYQAIFT